MPCENEKRGMTIKIIGIQSSQDTKFTKYLEIWPISIWPMNMWWHGMKCRSSRLDNIWCHNRGQQGNYRGYMSMHCLTGMLKSSCIILLPMALPSKTNVIATDSSKQTFLVLSYPYRVRNVLHNCQNTWLDILNELWHFCSFPSNVNRTHHTLFVYSYALVFWSYRSLCKLRHLHIQLYMLWVQCRR